MKIYRISKEKYIKDLTGTGARLYGGRWNPKGYAILYTSENRSLAALEVLVHLTPRSVPENLKILTLDIPESELIEFDRDKFAGIIKKKDSNRLFQTEGKRWIESGESLGLIVPSVLIPGENNVLINPGHENFSEIKIETIEEFIFDERFFIT